MIGVYPSRPPAQGFDMQHRRAYRAHRIIVNGQDCSPQPLVSGGYEAEFYPTQVNYIAEPGRVHSGDGMQWANPAVYRIAFRWRAAMGADPQWQTQWFSASLEGGAGCIGPARFTLEDDGRPEDERDFLTIRNPGDFTIFADGSASPVAEMDQVDGPDPRGVPLSTQANAFVEGRITVAGEVFLISLECTMIGNTVAGAEN